jgi:hypothetical protein
MTLCESLAHFTAHLHSKTLRPFLGWRVCNAANENKLCPVDGCVWPAGSKCTYSHCPERFTNSRTARPSRACAAGEAFDPRVSPNPLQNVSHGAPYTGDRA